VLPSSTRWGIGTVTSCRWHSLVLLVSVADQYRNQKKLASWKKIYSLYRSISRLREIEAPRRGHLCSCGKKYRDFKGHYGTGPSGRFEELNAAIAQSRHGFLFEAGDDERHKEGD
jgi:hypothetical protein